MSMRKTVRFAECLTFQIIWIVKLLFLWKKVKKKYIMIAKLYQWLIAGGIFLSIWSALLVDYVQSDIISQNKHSVFMLPIYLAVAFAVYSVAVVGYRVATFNNCDEAAIELQQQITEAREDLKKKGFVFTES